VRESIARMLGWIWHVRSVVATAIALGLAGNCFAAGEAAPADSTPALVISYQTSPSSRPRFLQLLTGEQSKRLARWRKDGVLERYQLLVNRYTDAGAWDAMAILTFKDSEQLSRWHQIERTAPGGLDGRVLGLTTSIQTAPVDLFRNAEAQRPRGHSAFAVIPYEYLVSLGDYEKYVDAYLIPQTQGWIDEQALQSYAMYLARYPAGRTWGALLVLEYTDDAALAQRPAVTKKVRERLANIPTWKAISESKQSIRTEGRLVVADQVSATAPP
jgi:hypothetical protein